jgi:fructose-1,6-bisphosphatase II / sedoheptulose-1,7-bisphosphatase
MLHFIMVGKKNKIAADQAAVDAMRNELNKIDMNGQIVIGEGELDEAPMLYIGEKLGTGNGPSLDIAVDPLEGTNFAANNLPGALSVIAVAEKSNLFNAPETYMHKIAIAINEKGIVDLDFPIHKNIKNLADYKNTLPENLTACILDRPRHQKIIEELKSLNVKLKLISDGDVSGALLVTDSKNNVDIFLGIGGGPEGVLAASALDAYNCFFQGKFIFDNEKDKNRAKKMGINDFEKKYELNEIVSGDSIFCATGITSGDLVNGIQIKDNSFVSETLITHKSSGIKKIYKSIHKI